MAVLPINKLAMTGLRKQIVAMIDNGVTRRKIELEAGVRLKDLNSWLEGTHAAEQLEQRLAAWIEDLERPQDDEPEPESIQTPTADRIKEAIEFARTTPSIAMIYGGAGVGKTVAAQRYAKSIDRCCARNVIRVTAGEFRRTPTAVLMMLAEQLGGGGRARRTDELMEYVVGSITIPGVIVVDEAQHLSLAAMNGLRAFYDEALIGIAYLGNVETFTRIARRGVAAQLESRVGIYINLTKPEPDDVDAVCASWGLRGREERAFAHQIAEAPGALRLLAHVLRQARLAARAMKRPLDAALMRGALDARGGLQ